MEAKFSKSLEAALSPVLLQLTEIHSSLSKTKQVAETALELGMALQSESRSHYEEISLLQDKVVTLAAAQKENNLKFLGMEDSQENNTDLISFMGNWLATVLGLEANIFPVITKSGDPPARASSP